MTPDFDAMTKRELRAYVIARPDDVTAFHAFVDRFTAGASSELFDIPKSDAEFKDAEVLLKQKLEQSR